MRTIIGKRKFWLALAGLISAFGVTIGTAKIQALGWGGLDAQLAKLWIGVAKDIALVVLGVYAGGRNNGSQEKITGANG